MNRPESSWLANRTIDTDLMAEASVLAGGLPLRNVSDFEDAASFLLKGGPVIHMGPRDAGRADLRPPREYWTKLREEFRLLLCTDDPKYGKLRKQLEQSTGKSNTVLVAVMAAALAEELGVAAGVLTGLIAVCLGAAIKLGKEAYCSQFDGP